jgi:hypothetical protein
MDRIIRTARILQPMLALFTVFYIWKTAGGTLDYALLSPDRWQNDTWAHPNAQIALATRLVYLAVWLTPIAFGLLAVGTATSMLGLVQNGVLFDARIANRFRLIGFGTAASGAADLVANFFSPMIISWHNPEGALPPSFYFNSESAGLILCGGGFYLVGWIMGEAITIARDNEGFI